jgi:hypothetical protein
MKTLSPKLKALFERLDARLRDLYRDRYRGLVLHGAHARGEAREGTTVAVLLLLDGPVDAMREILRTEDAVWTLAFEAGYTVGLLPVAEARFDTSNEPFLRDARRDGVRVP